jgi:hypothetical protein
VRDGRFERLKQDLNGNNHDWGWTSRCDKTRVNQEMKNGNPKQFDANE